MQLMLEDCNVTPGLNRHVQAEDFQDLAHIF